MPLGCYVPSLFPTYFTLCLSEAHITLNCALFSRTAWGRAPLLFWVYECVHEVLCVCDRPIHFCPCPSSPTVFKRKPLLSCHAGAQSVSMWAFPSFTPENKPTHILWQFHWLFFCQGKCVWLGTSTVCQAGYPAVLFNINLLLIVTLDMQTSLSKKPEWREKTLKMLNWCSFN